MDFETFKNRMNCIKELKIRKEQDHDWEYNLYLEGYQYGLRVSYHGIGFNDPIPQKYREGIKQHINVRTRLLSIGFNDAIAGKDINVSRDWIKSYDSTEQDKKS